MYKLYIDFTRPKSKYKLFSHIIRMFQGTPYSHVRIRWKNTTGQELIFEASGNKVKLIGEKAQDLNPVIILDSYEIDIRAGRNSEYGRLIELFKYSSLEYGILQVIGISLVYIFNLKKNPLSKGKKSQVCSELVAIFLEEVKGWNTELDLDIAGPKEINILLQKKIEEGNKEIRKVT